MTTCECGQHFDPQHQFCGHCGRSPDGRTGLNFSPKQKYASTETAENVASNEIGPRPLVLTGGALVVLGLVWLLLANPGSSDSANPDDTQPTEEADYPDSLDETEDDSTALAGSDDGSAARISWTDVSYSDNTVDLPPMGTEPGLNLLLSSQDLPTSLLIGLDEGFVRRVDLQDVTATSGSLVLAASLGTGKFDIYDFDDPSNRQPLNIDDPVSVGSSGTEIVQWQFGRYIKRSLIDGETLGSVEVDGAIGHLDATPLVGGLGQPDIIAARGGIYARTEDEPFRKVLSGTLVAHDETRLLVFDCSEVLVCAYWWYDRSTFESLDLLEPVAPTPERVRIEANYWLVTGSEQADGNLYIQDIEEGRLLPLELTNIEAYAISDNSRWLATTIVPDDSGIQRVVVRDLERGGEIVSKAEIMCSPICFWYPNFIQSDRAGGDSG